MFTILRLWCGMYAERCGVSVSGHDVTVCGGRRELETRSRDCTREFISQLDAVRLSRHKFFTGIDVEVIRSVCR